MIDPGRLDRRITLQRFTATKNSLNEDVETWGDLLTVSAMRQDVSDGERFAAGQTGSSLRSRFTIRRWSQTRTVTPQDRFLHDGAIWSIIGVKEAQADPRGFIEITAVRDAD